MNRSGRERPHRSSVARSTWRDERARPRITLASVQDRASSQLEWPATIDQRQSARRRGDWFLRRPRCTSRGRNWPMPTNSFASARWRGYGQPDTTVVAIHIRLDCVGTSANATGCRRAQADGCRLRLRRRAGPLCCRAWARFGPVRDRLRCGGPAMTQIRLN